MGFAENVIHRANNHLMGKMIIAQTHGSSDARGELLILMNVVVESGDGKFMEIPKHICC